MNNNYQQQPVYNQPQNNYQQPMNNQNSSNNKKLILLSVIIVIVLVVVIVFGISKLMKKDSPANNNADNQQIKENNDTSLTYDKDGAFLMPIEDVFTITGRGTVVTGKIERGTVKLNDEVEIVGLNGTRKTVIIGIEMFRKPLDYAEAGDNNVGLLLRGITRDDVKRGQVVAKTNSIKAIKKFDANVNILTKEEGGRDTPFFNNYKPQFYFRTTDITGVITLPSSIEKVNPGDSNVKITVELTSDVAMEVGTEFSIREGGRTIGTGIVTKLY